MIVEENFKLFGKLYSKSKENITKRYEELVQIFEFKNLEKKKYKTLSGGQKRNVEIARALFILPKFFFSMSLQLG